MTQNLKPMSMDTALKALLIIFIGIAMLWMINQSILNKRSAQLHNAPPPASVAKPFPEYDPRGTPPAIRHGSEVSPGKNVGIGGIAEGVGDQPMEAAPGVTNPVPVLQPMPSYTDEARKAHVQGVVLIQAVIRKNGTVASLKVVKSLGYGLDESAIQTIANKWHFKPGTYNGYPVDVRANIEVRFSMY
jgi:TonB family protein